MGDQPNMAQKSRMYVYAGTELIEAVEQVAENRDQSVSEFMREAARRELQDGYKGDTK